MNTNISALAVRPYELSDEEAVVALWNVAFPDPAPHNDPQTAIARKQEIQRELFFVATIEERLVGTALAGYDGHRGWVYSVAVDPECRRRGIGAMLMTRVESELACIGCPKLNLQVLASNSEVVAFYHRLGYHVEERVSMGKLLTGKTDR
ncbi:MAG: GNAT family acetyltransferase [candidate division Zixibacteria bacterium]|nr:GNAT family acetyltransferase [candidate division Zixibacteria bacterium]